MECKSDSENFKGEINSARWVDNVMLNGETVYSNVHICQLIICSIEFGAAIFYIVVVLLFTYFWKNLIDLLAPSVTNYPLSSVIVFSIGHWINLYVHILIFIPNSFYFFSTCTYGKYTLQLWQLSSDKQTQSIAVMVKCVWTDCQHCHSPFKI